MTACLVSTVAYNLINELSIKFSHSVFWTDSSTTLHLIRNAFKRFDVFMAGRLSQISSLSPINAWRHCPMVENPVHIGTRMIKYKCSKLYRPHLYQYK